MCTKSWRWQVYQFPLTHLLLKVFRPLRGWNDFTVIVWNGRSLSSWPFPFMGMFDHGKDPIPLIQSPRGSIRSFQLQYYIPRCLHTFIIQNFYDRNCLLWSEFIGHRPSHVFCLWVSAKIIPSSISPMHHKSKQSRLQAWDDDVAPHEFVLAWEQQISIVGFPDYRL